MLLNKNQSIRFNRLLLILLIATAVWFFIPCPTGLSAKAWHLIIIFVFSMTGIMLEVSSNSAILFMSLLISSLTATIDIKKGFSGFSNFVPWLLFFILALSKSITKSTIGIRIAYMFMRLFGKGLLGLSYSITLTELCVAPILPSNTARAASIGLPLVKSLSSHISSNVLGVSEKSIGAYFSILYAYSNSICSAMFLTAMISNALIIEYAQNIGIKLTWISWFGYTAIPCLIILAILPILLRILFNPKVSDLGNIREVANKNYKDLGPLTKKERLIIFVFGAMLLMWIFADSIGITVMTTTILGVCILLLFGILNTNEMLSCSSTFNSVFTLGLLMSYVDLLREFGAIDWFNNIVSHSINTSNPSISLFILSILYFFAHYFFSGEGSMIVALYVPFLATGVALGIDKIPLIITLAVFTSFSDVLSHYTGPCAITMFSSGYVSVKKWMSKGFIVACVLIAIWFLYLCVRF